MNVSIAACCVPMSGLIGGKLIAVITVTVYDLTSIAGSVTLYNTVCILFGINVAVSNAIISTYGANTVYVVMSNYTYGKVRILTVMLALRLKPMRESICGVGGLISGLSAAYSSADITAAIIHLCVNVLCNVDGSNALASAICCVPVIGGIGGPLITVILMYVLFITAGNKNESGESYAQNQTNNLFHYRKVSFCLSKFKQ